MISNDWLATPASKIRDPETGRKSSLGVALPPVADQATPTPPTRLGPVRVTVTRTVPPSTTLAVALANWTVPADCRSRIVSVAMLGVPMDAPLALPRLSSTVLLPLPSTPSLTVGIENVRLVTALSVSVPLVAV